MLRPINKINKLYKSYLGLADSGVNKETFEEPFRYNDQIDNNNVLIFWNIIPKSDDENLPITINDFINFKSSTDNILYYNQTPFRSWPLIKKVTVKLTPISLNSSNSYIALDENGVPYYNIIPFDLYKDLYNYTLTSTYDNVEIPFGLNDWHFDTKTGILNFYNGVPENVSTNFPPIISFFQYVGPVGSLPHLEGLFIDSKGEFDIDSCTADITEYTNTIIENSLGKDWLVKNGFNGSEITEGYGLIFNRSTPVIDFTTNDPINGYDNDSSSQVLSFVSHISGTCDNSELQIIFISEAVNSDTDISKLDNIVLNKGLNLIYLNNIEEFIVINNNSPDEIQGILNFRIVETNKIIALLTVRDKETNINKVFIPREQITCYIKVPIIADIESIPPSLKLQEFNSYHDSITPQYYGPRTYDFVIADNDTSIDFRSADFITYKDKNINLDNALISAFSKDNLTSILLRSGIYTIGNNVPIQKNVSISSNNNFTQLDEGTFILKENSICTFYNITFLENVQFLFESESATLIFINCNLTNLILDDTVNDTVNDTVKNNCLIINSSNINGRLNLNNINCNIYGSNINSFEYLKDEASNSKFYITSSCINELNIHSEDVEGVIDTSNIITVINKPLSVRLEASYVTKFLYEAADIAKANTIPYWKEKSLRVFPSLPKTLHYNEDENRIDVLIDNDTIQVDENGVLFARKQNSDEISLNFDGEIKTQFSNKYPGEKQDSLFDRDPQTVAEAILDLYWAKADLKNGKVPLQQLPDSVAYGGLHYVGNWSFDDHNGQYPTFDDVVNSLSLDDEVTELQPGWFFICAPPKGEEKDPSKPQIAIDGEIYTAGDWIIYQSKEEIIEILNNELVKGLDTRLIGTLLGEGEEIVDLSINDDGLATINGYIENDSLNLFSLNKPQSNLNDDIISSSIISSEDIESDLTEIYEANGEFKDIDKKIFIPNTQNGNQYEINVNSVEIIKEKDGGNKPFITFNVLKNNTINIITTLEEDLSIYGNIENSPIMLFFYKRGPKKNSTFTTKTVKLNFQKLDRAYQEAALSRLPSLDPDGNEWSFENGGNGKFDLSLQTISEAFKLVNNQLQALSLGYPNKIKNIELEIANEPEDYKFEYKKLLKENYFMVDNSNVYTAYSTNEADTLNFKIKTVDYTNNKNSLLDTCYYVHDTSLLNDELSFTGFENDNNVEINISNEVFNPYKKWNLGTIQNDDIFAAYSYADIVINNCQSTSKTFKDLKLKYTFESDKILNNRVLESEYSGSTKPINSIELKNIYDFSDTKIHYTDSPYGQHTNDWNKSISSFYGDQYFITQPLLKGSFKVEKLFKDVYIPSKADNIKDLFKLEIINFNKDKNEVLKEEILITSISLSENVDDANYLDAIISFDSINKDILIEDVDSVKLNLKISWFFNKEYTFNVFSIENQRYLETVNLGPIYLRDEHCKAGQLYFPDLMEYGFGEEVDNNYLNNDPNQVFELVYDNINKYYKVPSVDTQLKNMELPWTKTISERGGYSYYDESSDSGRYRFLTVRKKLDQVYDISGFSIVIDWVDTLPEINPTTGHYKEVKLIAVASSDKTGKTMDCNKSIPAYYNPDFNAIQNPCCHPGKSSIYKRYISFGVALKQANEIYVRIGLREGSNLKFKDINILDIH